MDTSRSTKKPRGKSGKWFQSPGGNWILRGKGFYLSYQDHKNVLRFLGGRLKSMRNLDSLNPETAIVIENGKGKGSSRFLIFRGDRRKELEILMPSLPKLKAYWKLHGGHFWSDGLK